MATHARPRLLVPLRLRGHRAAATTSVVTFSGPISGESFGRAIASAGEFNGDGYPDVIVSASHAAYLFYGGPCPDNAPDLVFIPASGNFAMSLAGIGDFNGDGYSDGVTMRPLTQNC